MRILLLLTLLLQRHMLLMGNKLKSKEPFLLASQRISKQQRFLLVGFPIPASVTDDELKGFFSKYGKVVEHEIIRDHATNRSRGFGFIVFDSEQVADTILVDGNMIDMNGTQVEIKKAPPLPPP